MWNYQNIKREEQTRYSVHTLQNDGTTCDFYGSETRIVYARTSSRIQASEMKLLRFVLRVSRRDRLMMTKKVGSAEIYNRIEKIQ